MKNGNRYERASNLPICFYEESNGIPLKGKRCGIRQGMGILTDLCLLCLIVSMIILGSGCNGYQCGTRSLYRNEIKTVFVPMVQTDSWRKALGERLTEAVCKRITERTPFDLAGPGDADTVLAINLVADNHSVSIMNRYNDTAQKTINWSIIAVWKDKRENILAQLDPIPLSGEGVSLNEQAFLVAEMGQSNATTQQDVIDKLADRIVGLMEEPW